MIHLSDPPYKCAMHMQARSKEQPPDVYNMRSVQYLTMHSYKKGTNSIDRVIIVVMCNYLYAL